MLLLGVRTRFHHERRGARTKGVVSKSVMFVTKRVGILVGDHRVDLAGARLGVLAFFLRGPGRVLSGARVLRGIFSLRKSFISRGAVTIGVEELHRGVRSGPTTPICVGGVENLKCV